MPRAKRSLTTPPSTTSETTNHRAHIKLQSKSVDLNESNNSSIEVPDFTANNTNHNFADDLSLHDLAASEFYQEHIEMQSANFTEGLF